MYLPVGSVSVPGGHENPSIHISVPQLEREALIESGIAAVFFNARPSIRAASHQAHLPVNNTRLKYFQNNYNQIYRLDERGCSRFELSVAYRLYSY